jgi:hypothetical protein
LLRQLPQKTGMAYVLVQHLDPKHGSELREILARTTRIPVLEVTDRAVVEPDRIYVIPPNTSMVLQDGALRLAARVLTRGQHLPIDHSLRSLAEARGNRAISAILSARPPTAPKAPAPSRWRAELLLPGMRSPPNMPACRTARSRPAAWILSCRQVKLPGS